MKTQTSIFLALGIIIGSIITFTFTQRSSNAEPAIQMDHEMHMQSSTPMSMESMMMDMNASLKGKNADEFDKAFLSEMIIHHQGAIDMAELAKVNAKHEEIKRLSDEIITAQTKEIEMMKQWQKQWGY